MEKKALRIGLNLGGWISQYPAYDDNHFKTFITADDIKRIADWGIDHVRLPVDYPVLEDPDQARAYIDSGFGYIENCLDWCGENELRVVLDLHKAPGFAFDAQAENNLFGSPALQDRFLALWEEIARRFAHRSDEMLAFELLNEIVLPSSDPWNALYPQTVERIRAVSPQRLIVLGGNFFNDATQMHELTILDDSRILYTFHFYRPMAITHQMAPWVPIVGELSSPVEYPGSASSEMEILLKQYQQSGAKADPGLDLQAPIIKFIGGETGVRFDKEYLRGPLGAAIEFSHRNNQPVYCGEFGVYEGAPIRTRINWTRDFIELLNEAGIGRAYWTYKALDFGLVDKAGKVVNQELVDIVCKG